MLRRVKIYLEYFENLEKTKCLHPTHLLCRVGFSGRSFSNPAKKTEEPSCWRWTLSIAQSTRRRRTGNREKPRENNNKPAWRPLQLSDRKWNTNFTFRDTRCFQGTLPDTRLTINQKIHSFPRRRTGGRNRKTADAKIRRRTPKSDDVQVYKFAGPIGQTGISFNWPLFQFEALSPLQLATCYYENVFPTTILIFAKKNQKIRNVINDFEIKFFIIALLIVKIPKNEKPKMRAN